MNGILGRNDSCWCGSGIKYKKCHAPFDEQLAAFRQQGHTIPPHDIIKTPQQIEGIRESGKVNTAVLDAVARQIQPGMTTEEIDQIVYVTTTKLGGVPAPLDYQGFPKSVCTSINDQVCHGIPSDQDILRDGDIINVDVSTVYKGYFSDASRMFCIGRVPEDKRRLVGIARECMQQGMKQVRPWALLGEVGQAVQDHARKHGCTVVREIGGHGIGLEFHEEPFVSYVANAGTGMVMAPGMVFTVEPMINRGAADVYIDDSNGWTVYTEDGTPSAQWEATVAVTENGYEILAW